MPARPSATSPASWCARARARPCTTCGWPADAATRPCPSRSWARPPTAGTGGDPFGANLAPTPGTPLRGPISVLQSYARIDYGRICNGGPITLELSDSVFRGADSIAKVAGLVRTFAQLGGQQLQLNALSADRLLAAKAHPEEHRDLIVRVWGWSGYFCELSPEYQDHVISRHLYAEV